MSAAIAILRDGGCERIWETLLALPGILGEAKSNGRSGILIGSYRADSPRPLQARFDSLECRSGRIPVLTDLRTRARAAEVLSVGRFVLRFADQADRTAEHDPIRKQHPWLSRPKSS